MKIVTNKYISEIWSLYQKHARPSGMANYGIGLDAQRNLYNKLPSQEKRKYEEAVLELCQSDDVQKANASLYLCSELSDAFPDDWAVRVIPVVEHLVNKDLQPIYKNTITYAVLRLIWSFNIYSLVPFVKVFNEQITMNFKQGALPMSDWELLYGQVSRIFIKISPEDFWNNFRVFHDDDVLLKLLSSETKAIILSWSNFGALCYGLEWLSRLVEEYSRIPDGTLKIQALSSIEQSSSIVISMNPTARISVKEFLHWAKEKLGSH